MAEAEVRDFRYERKFLVEELDAGQARLLVRRHPAMFCAPYPPRHVNNLYLDTEEMENYYANVNGVDERVKVRIRWYGELFGEIAKPVLEFKIKSGLVGTKHIYPFPSFRLDDTFDGASFRKLVQRTDLPDQARMYLRDLEVVLCNRYHRWYYATHDQHFRVTVDHEMVYYQVRRFCNHFRYRFLDARNIIVELKYDKPQDVQADRVAGFFPFIVTKNSKYVTGIERVYL
jgi:hypothetical protein